MWKTEEESKYFRIAKWVFFIPKKLRKKDKKLNSVKFEKNIATHIPGICMYISHKGTYIYITVLLFQPTKYYTKENMRVLDSKSCNTTWGARNLYFTTCLLKFEVCLEKTNFRLVTTLRCTSANTHTTYTYLLIYQCTYISVSLFIFIVGVCFVCHYVHLVFL